MSDIVRMAIRIAATGALMDQTLAEGRVFDSAIDPIDANLSENREPIIIITTDDQTAQVEGRDLHGMESSLDLVLETAVANVVEVEGEGGIINVPQTDGWMEIVLDLLGDQITQRLIGGNAWAEVFKRFVPRFHNILSRRGASTEDGLRFAARQTIITLDHIARPSPGQDAIDPGSPWGQLLALMDADPKFLKVADVMRKQLLGDSLTDFERVVHDLGLTTQGAAGIGLEPLKDDQVPPQDGGPVTEIVVDVTDPHNDDFVVNETEAEEQWPGGGS